MDARFVSVLDHAEVPDRADLIYFFGSFFILTLTTKQNVGATMDTATALLQSVWDATELEPPPQLPLSSPLNEFQHGFISALHHS